MDNVTYNTSGYNWMTYIGLRGNILSDRLVDLSSESDVGMLATAQQQAPGRVFVRPASVAIVNGDGAYTIDKVDAVVANGQLVNEYSGLCKGECVVEITTARNAGAEALFGVALAPQTDVRVLPIR